MADPEIVVEHPNRETAAAKATRGTVIALLLVSALLLVVVSAGGWDALVGAKALHVIYVVLYVGMALLVARWSRGTLPVAAALAILLAIFGAVSVPGWIARDKDGFTDPALASDVLGLLCALLVLLQVLLIAFAMRGFRQAWNVEVEQPAERGPRGRPAAAPA